MCRVAPESVQVDLRGDGETGHGAKRPEHVHADSRAAEREFLAGVEQGRIGRRQQALAQHLALFRPREAGGRPRLGRRQWPFHGAAGAAPRASPHGRRAGRRRTWVAPPWVRFRRPSGFQYSAREFRHGRALRILVSMMMAIVPRACSASRTRCVALAEVTVVAPDRNRSGASNSLTPRRAAARRFVRRARVLRQRHAHRLRAPRDLRPVRLRARHGRVGDQPWRQPRRRRAVFRNRRGGDRRSLPRLADDGSFAGGARRRALRHRGPRGRASS